MAAYKGAKNTLNVSVGRTGRMTFGIAVAAGNENKEVSLKRERVLELKTQIDTYLGVVAGAAPVAAVAPARAGGVPDKASILDRVRALHDEVDAYLQGDREALENARDDLANAIANLE